MYKIRAILIKVMSLVQRHSGHVWSSVSCAATVMFGWLCTPATTRLHRGVSSDLYVDPKQLPSNCLSTRRWQREHKVAHVNNKQRECEPKKNTPWPFSIRDLLTCCILRDATRTLKNYGTKKACAEEIYSLSLWTLKLWQMLVLFLFLFDPGRNIRSV